MVKRKICIVTATRAEYGLLKPLLKAVVESSEFELQLVVTGTHLSPEFGLTWRAIADEGFFINEKVEILLSSDTASATCKSMGIAVGAFGDVFARLSPDLVVILGDRYEMLGVAAAATICQVPIAHLHGGESTFGAVDEAFRHSITKMSHLHFVSTAEYRKRVVQLGEDPAKVFDVGAIGLEAIKNVELLSRNELATAIGVDLSIPFFLVTYHPQTVGSFDAEMEINLLCEALISVDGAQAIITKANADVGGRAVNSRLEFWAAKAPKRLHVFTSLGSSLYFSAMRESIAVVGNSSSGIIEAPSFAVPTINIGSRQLGRISADSVWHVAVDKDAIRIALHELFEKAKNPSRTTVWNPYGDGNTVRKILSVLNQTDFSLLKMKVFYDLNFSI